ncbi:developmental pluripotency-associated protein 4-like isoform X1 [Microtus oregoni]|uniref:developmental pluripotency-associated protein 4-like isoform X1 n=1 Tax=Microtus oregoni TaxID=111838 RepID=UPI001BB27D6C|nr:developmental pluripotency-associated protein 4-like isoform X1 [Microtus oregoni]
MEDAGNKELSSTGEPREVDCLMSSQPSTSFAKPPAKKKRANKTAKEDDCKSNKKAGDAETPKPTPRKIIAVPPLPDYLPPVNLIHRDVLREWCKKQKLSSKGQKLETYKRLLASSYPKQMTELENIPDTPREARVKMRRKKLKTETEEGQETCPQVIVPLEVVPVPEEQMPALTEPPVFYEEVSTTVVTTTASEAVLASWSRIAANANKNEALQSITTPETNGDLWCVVHGRSLPADSRGWVRLQFHAGQAWVPEKKGKVIALFLLPACTFPPPHLEDNMLCPMCVHKNRILNKSLQG